MALLLVEERVQHQGVEQGRRQEVELARRQVEVLALALRLGVEPVQRQEEVVVMEVVLVLQELGLVL